MNFLINTYHEQFPVSGNISSKTKIDYFPANQYTTYEYIRKHYIAVRVYYNELKYTFISEEPETKLFNFVSNIGGILGWRFHF